MMVVLYKVISFGKNVIVCMVDVHIMCVCSLCDPTGTYNCESDVTDGLFEWFIDSVTGGLGT